MVTADYRHECGFVQELPVSGGEVQVRCCKCVDSVPVEFRRVWTPVRVGRVPGAGGSPAR